MFLVANFRFLALTLCERIYLPMATIFDNLQNERQYLASTGLNKADFEKLHQVFAQYYKPKNNNDISNKAALLTCSREALFFILFYFKSYPTLEVLGLSFGFSNTSAFVYVDYIKPYLKAALQAESVLVKRMFDHQDEFDKAFQGVEDIFVDGSEISIQRACIQHIQQGDYSGKKNAHADSLTNL